jgi:hypothetical protein
VEELDGERRGTLTENIEELALPFLSGEELILPFNSNILALRGIDASTPITGLSEFGMQIVFNLKSP